MLKHIKCTDVLMALAYVVAGVLLVIFPDISAKYISYIVGITSIVYGIVSLTAYFLADIRETLYNNHFVVGLITIIFGLAVIVKRDLIMNLVPFVLGLLIVTSGLVKLHRAVIAARIKYNASFKYASFTYALLGVVSIIVGIVVMFFLSGETTQNIIFIIIGCGLIYSGASDLFIQFFLASKFNAFMKRFEGAVKDAQSNVINVEAVEKPQEDEQSNDSDMEG